MNANEKLKTKIYLIEKHKWNCSKVDISPLITAFP